MSEITKIRLLAMLDNELEQVAGMISKERLWAQGSATEEEWQAHLENAVDLKEYNELLVQIRKKVVEGDLNV